MNAWHAIEADDVIRILGSSEDGLSQGEAAGRLAKYGPNEISLRTRTSPLTIFLRQFKNTLTIILIIAALLSILVEEPIDAILIIAIVIAAAALGFVQEYRAERALEALQSMLDPTVTVLRGGSSHVISTREVVPGDIIVLKEGDRIPADARLVQSVNLKVDEAILTGESIPVQKTTDPLPADTPISDRRNMVMSGTVATYGKGVAVVVATGMSTEFGKIAESVATVQKEATPLEKRTAEIGFWLGAIAISVCAIVVGIAVLRELIMYGAVSAEFLVTMLLFGIALAVAVVPEALAGVVTGSLAIGMQRMARENALVRKMSAVETLGCTSVICSDKTGTITRGEMTVREVVFPDTVLAVEGEGYQPEGNIRIQKGNGQIKEQDRYRILMEACVLCGDADVILSDGRWKLVGDPTEGALVTLAMKAGIDPQSLRKQRPRTGEVPFSSERKRMTTVHSAEHGPTILYMKGAPEAVLDRCTYMHGANDVKRLTDKDREMILLENSQMAARALRVLGIAYKVNDDDVDTTREDRVESEFIFLGLAGMIDPARKEAIEAISACRAVGIRPIMITGDHKLTATAIADEVGIRRPGDVVLTDTEMQPLSDDEFANMVDRVSVYARVSPGSKLKIVRAWQKRGEIVAMTGDGVNDAPALKQANIGVAMGITGTEVTKEAADLVLADDNFATITRAVELGRWIYDNIKKYLAYLLRANLIEIVVLSFAILVGYPLPLLPAQILYINLVTDGLPAIALGLSPPDPDIMKRPPRNPSESIFSREVRRFIKVAMLVEVPL
ncbi:MAG: HAD-IC family P-type ATPase, partial [Candidatus Thorarchaeota archaeon]